MTMKLIKLEIDHIGGIDAFEMNPNGEHVVIGGPNGAGKSTVLHSIAGALGGGRNRKSEVVKRGAKEGSVILDLGDLVVRWGAKAGGRQSLEVTNSEGDVKRGPQELLSRLWGERSFDPTAFAALSAKERVAALAKLLGFDVEAYTEERKALFDQRTLENRQAKELVARAAGIVVPDGTPDEKVDEAALTTELRKADEQRRMNQMQRGQLPLLENHIGLARLDVTRVREAGNDAVLDAKKRGEELVAEAEAALLRAHVALDNTKERADSDLRAAKHQAVENAKAALERVQGLELKRGEVEAVVASLVEPDVAGLEMQLARARVVNAAVEQARLKEMIEVDADDHVKAAGSLTAAIEALDARQAEAIAEARLPIAGLGFADDDVTFEGKPLDLLSESERLRISVAIGLAQHPEIGIMLIDRWGDLDADRRAMVMQMADEAGCQIITTVVGERDEDITVTIREGKVAK
jgi:energy-coupling factor transporter ATP-binding protein EcfA2